MDLKLINIFIEVLNKTYKKQNILFIIYYLFE